VKEGASSRVLKHMTQHTIQPRAISKDLHRYAGQWVALSPDYSRIVAHGTRLKEVVAAIPAKERTQVVFHKVLPKDADYAPVTL
jgi:hypothetical protein